MKFKEVKKSFVFLRSNGFVGTPFNIYVKQRVLQDVLISKCSIVLTRYHNYRNAKGEYKQDSHVLHTTTLVSDLALQKNKEMKLSVQLTIPTSEPASTKGDTYPIDVWFMSLTTRLENVDYVQAIHIDVE